LLCGGDPENRCSLSLRIDGLGLLDLEFELRVHDRFDNRSRSGDRLRETSRLVSPIFPANPPMRPIFSIARCRIRSCFSFCSRPSLSFQNLRFHPSPSNSSPSLPSSSLNFQLCTDDSNDSTNSIRRGSVFSDNLIAFTLIPAIGV
jgi:hypothetical protein